MPEDDPGGDASFRYPPPPPTAGVSTTLADWWRRAVAIVLDIFIVAAPMGIVGAVFGLIKTTTLADGTTRYEPRPALLLLGSIATLAYSAVMDGGPRGATVGKMAMKIRVVDATTGMPIGTGRAFVRRLVYLLLFNALIVPGIINALSPLWDKRRQAWHDRAANSLVVTNT